MSVTATIRPKVQTLITPRRLNITQAARYLGVGHKIVRKMIQSGELLYYQRIPGHSPYLIDIRDLDRLIETQKIRANSL